MHYVDNNVKFTCCKIKMFENRSLGIYLAQSPMKADPVDRAV
jgi:hypothetical protein